MLVQVYELLRALIVTEELLHLQKTRTVYQNWGLQQAIKPFKRLTTLQSVVGTISSAVNDILYPAESQIQRQVRGLKLQLHVSLGSVFGGSYFSCLVLPVSIFRVLSLRKRKEISSSTAESPGYY